MAGVDLAAGVNRGGYNKEMSHVQSKLLLIALVTMPLACPPGIAASVPDLYVAQVPTTALSGPGLEDAFSRALDVVLVKVTGQRAVTIDPARRRALGPAGPLVRQYQPGAGGQVRVSFDPVALRRRLDAANLPVWADDRPRTLVILPDDSTPAPGAQQGPGGTAVPLALPVSTTRQLLLDAANRRGVPVVLAPAPVPGAPAAEDPMLDPEATARAAGASLLLIGRRGVSAGPAVLRWTLVQGTERAEWQGDGAAGAEGLADRLAGRYASTVGTGRVLRVRIDGVDTFDAYGRLQSYLRSVDLIQSADLQRVNGGALLFELTVRGDVRQLNDAFELQQVLTPVADSGTGELVYRLATSSLEAP